jgi:enoyl-CoA hydratase
MKFENLITVVENGILTVTINREEKLNSLNKKIIQELEKVFTLAQKQKEVKAIILTGAGQKAFVAGADIAELMNLNVKQAKSATKYGHKVFKQIENCSKPVLAAVNGYALGGGCELAMACHLRIASDNAKFGQPEVNLGLIAGYGGTQRLTQYIGKTKSMELHMSGAIINADEALKLGLVNYVVPQTELISKCKELLQTIMSKSPLAVSAVIRTVNAFYEKKDGFAKEQEEFSKSFGKADFKEGVSAFLEKRKPNFQGK